MSSAAPEPSASRPPLGSWPRTYAATIAVAIAVIALLWVLTAKWNVPLGSAR